MELPHLDELGVTSEEAAGRRRHIHFKEFASRATLPRKLIDPESKHCLQSYRLKNADLGSSEPFTPFFQARRYAWKRVMLVVPDPCGRRGGTEPRYKSREEDRKRVGRRTRKESEERREQMR